MQTSDGLRLDVWTEGPADAPVTAVLSHGWTEDHRLWHYQVDDLRHRFGAGLRIVTYDLRGHGSSDAAPLATCDIAHVGRDLGELIDQVAPTGPLVLAGHSLGGMAIMELAGLRPELFAERVRGVLFANTSAGRLDEISLGLPVPKAIIGGGVRAQFARAFEVRARMLSRRQRISAPTVETQVLKRYVFGDAYRMSDLMICVESIVACPPATMRGFFADFMRHERHVNLAALADVPTRVLVGSKDKMTPAEHSRRLAARVPGSRLFVSPDAGHMLPLERPAHVTDQLALLVDGASTESAVRQGQASQAQAGPAPVSVTQAGSGRGSGEGRLSAS